MKGCFILLGILASSNVVLNSNGMWFAVWWIVLFQFLVYDFLALMLNTCVKVERRRDGEREREEICGHGTGGENELESPPSVSVCVWCE